MRWIWLVGLVLVAGCAQPAAIQDPVARAAALGLAIDRVLPVATADCAAAGSRRSCDFDVRIDDRPGHAPNAFLSLDPAGHPVITLTRALVEDVRSVDELAFVLGHEAAHHIHGHLGQQVTDAQGGPVDDRTLLALFAAARHGRVDPAKLGLRRADVDLPMLELEADATGLRLAHAAGFEGAAALGFVARLSDPAQTGSRTHPARAARLASLRAVLADL